MRTGRIMGWIVATLLVWLMVCGCDSGPSTGNALFVFNWPEAAGFSRVVDFTAMQSLKLEIFDATHTLHVVVINRSLDAQSQVPFTARLGTLDYLLTAYAGPNASGSILGQARGLVRFTTSTNPVPIYLTTLLDPNATLAILPLSPAVYADKTLQLFAQTKNPDNTQVVMPLNTLTWATDDLYLADVDPRTGLVTGMNAGDVLISVNDSLTNLTATTTVKVTYEPPAVKLTASKSRVSPGEKVILSWESTNATRVNSSVNFNTTLLNGTLSVYPIETTTYTITVRGPGGTDSDNVTITVDYPQPTVALTATSSNIPAGQSVTLRWSSTYATSVDSSVNFNTTAVNGSTTVAPGSTTTYTITVRGPGGITSSSVTITVNSS